MQLLIQAKTLSVPIASQNPSCTNLNTVVCNRHVVFLFFALAVRLLLDAFHLTHSAYRRRQIEKRVIQRRRIEQIAVATDFIPESELYNIKTGTRAKRKISSASLFTFGE